MNLCALVLLTGLCSYQRPTGPMVVPAPPMPTLPGAAIPPGVWEQKTEAGVVRLLVQDGRLRMAALDKGGKPLWLVESDYSVTRDSILFGIVTSTETGKNMEAERAVPAPPPPTTLQSVPGAVGSNTGSRGAAPEGRLGGKGTVVRRVALKPKEADPLVGQPDAPPPPLAPVKAEGKEGVARPPVGVDELFRFRFRVDEDVLTIKDMKAPEGAADTPFVLKGRFQRVDAPRPACCAADAGREEKAPSATAVALPSIRPFR